MKYTPPLGSLEADAPYVDGNPTAGIRGSVVPAAPFNQLQKELVHIITQAGLEPSADNLTQVLAALKKLFAAPSAIIPPDGVTIIEKEIESGKKVLAAASAGTLDTLEAWRKSMIGAPMMLPSPVLPDGYMWPDGTLASFEDWPELEEAYEAGKFEGYVLPASATDDDKKNYPGKWVLAANSAGLYTPRLTGLFARYCADTGAGAYQADAIQTGITRLIVGAWSPDSSAGIVSPVGNVTVSTESTTSGAVASTAPLRYLVDIKQRTADKTRPENVSLSIALYLGSFAKV